MSRPMVILMIYRLEEALKNGWSGYKNGNSKKKGGR